MSSISRPVGASKRRRTVIKVLVFASCVAILVSARPWFVRAFPALASMPAQDSEAGTTPVTIPANTDQTLILALNPLGFGVDELVLQAGVHLLLIRNSSARQGEDLTINIERPGDTEASRSFTIRDRENRWFDIDVKPGEYFVSSTSHPDRRIRVTVVP